MQFLCFIKMLRKCKIETVLLDANSQYATEIHIYLFVHMSCCCHHLLLPSHLGVKTCEVFLCFVTIMSVLSFVLTSLFSLFYVTHEGDRFLHRG